MKNRLTHFMKKGVENPIMVYVFAFMIPIAGSLPEMGMAVLALFLEQIIRWSPVRWNTIKAKLTWKNPAVWLFLLYVMYLVGLSYSSNMKYGWGDVGMKATFAILPLYFLLFTINLDWKKLQTFFLVGTFASIALNIGLYFYYASTMNHSEFYYFKGEQLSHLMHRGYWAVYLAIAYFFIIRNLARGEKQKLQIVYAVVQAFILLIFVALSGSKMGLILVGLITIWGMIQGVKRMRNKWIVWGAIVSILFIGAGIFQTDSTLSTRFKEMASDTVKPFQEMNKLNPGSTSARRMTWDASLSLIKEHFWCGVGTGDVKDALIQRDREKGYIGIAKAQLNCHNQLLNTQLTIGILGLLFLLLTFGVNFLKCGSDRNRSLRTGITLLLFLAMFTESMLETQAGIIPYAFLLCLIATPCFENLRKNPKENIQSN